MRRGQGTAANKTMTFTKLKVIRASLLLVYGTDGLGDKTVKLKNHLNCDESA